MPELPNFENTARWWNSILKWPWYGKGLLGLLTLILVWSHFSNQKTRGHPPFQNNAGRDVMIYEIHDINEVIVGQPIQASKPDLRIEFIQAGPSFQLTNTGQSTAEIPRYGFGIWDLEVETNSVLPIPWKEVSYVPAGDGMGPWSLLDNFGKQGHRYFGFAKVTCRNCVGARLYWLYVVPGKAQESWYVEIKPEESRQLDVAKLKADPGSYLFSRVPIESRVPFGNRGQ